MEELARRDILIEGEAPEIDETKNLEAVIDDTVPPSDFLDITKDKDAVNEDYNTVKEAFEKTIKRVKKKETKAKRLETVLKQSAEIYEQLNHEEKETLGYLTTLYATYKFEENDKGILQIDSLDFLKDLGLGQAEYLLSGLTNARIKGVTFGLDKKELVGRAMLYNVQNVAIDNIHVPGGYEILHNAKKVKISRIANCGKYFAAESEDVEIQVIKYCGSKFGKDSTRVQISEVESAGDKFGDGSTSMIIGLVKFVKGGFAVDSDNMTVKEIVKATDNLATNSEKFKVELVRECGFNAFYGSKNATVGRVLNAGNTFAAGSEHLTVKYVGNVEDDFGVKSKHLEVEDVGKAKHRFGDSSEYLEVTGKIEEVSGLEFGKGSTDLSVKEIVKFDSTSAFLKDSKGAMVGNLPTRAELEEKNFGFVQEPCKNYAIRLSSGRILTDLGTDGVRSLDKFGHRDYHNTMDLLSVRNGDSID